MSDDIPDNLDDIPPKIEIGGALGRTASVQCKQGQHDLCGDEDCRCRCHGRLWYDRPLHPSEV